MPEKIAYVNKIYPCPHHMDSFTVAEYMRRHWKIYIQQPALLCLPYILVNDI